VVCVIMPMAAARHPGRRRSGEHGWSHEQRVVVG
jgi:hypothetical protein